MKMEGKSYQQRAIPIEGENAGSVIGNADKKITR